MLRRKIAIILALALTMLVFGCSGSSIPTTPGDAIDSPLRTLAGDIEIINPDIEISEMSVGIEGTFFPDNENGRYGIEVRIDGELAAVTDETGTFELPPEVPEGSQLEFAVEGEVFYKTTLGPERHAQGPSGPAGEGYMYGYVIDEDGVVPMALVIVTDGDTYAFDISNSLGIYNISGAPTGHVLLIAAADFHYTKMKAIDLVPNEPWNINIVLQKAEGYGTLYGRTYVPGYGLMGGVYVNFTMPGGLVREDISNVYGMYELLAIPAGVGHLYAHEDGFHDFHHNMMINPGFNAMDIPMVPIASGVVMGDVQTPDGYKVIGALVRLTFVNIHGNHEWRFAYTVNDGKFCFADIPPGSYAVQAFAPGWHPAIAIGTVFEGNIEEEHLVIYQTEETGTLEGWAVDFEGGPVPFAFAYVELIGYKNVLAGWMIADENGYFHVQGLPYGAYAIRVESAAFLPDWTYTDILPGDDGDFLKVLYPYNPLLSGALTGTVYDSNSEPEPYAMVRIYAAVDPNISYFTLTNAAGVYMFPWLPPTIYNAIAIGENDEVGYGWDEVTLGGETVLDIHIE